MGTSVRQFLVQFMSEVVTDLYLLLHQLLCGLMLHVQLGQCDLKILVQRVLHVLILLPDFLLHCIVIVTISRPTDEKLKL